MLHLIFTLFFERLIVAGVQHLTGSYFLSVQRRENNLLIKVDLKYILLFDVHLILCRIMLELSKFVGGIDETEFLNLASQIMTASKDVIKDWCKTLVRENELSEKLTTTMGVRENGERALNAKVRWLPRSELGSVQR